MPRLIDFASLDLRGAFDFAIMIEEDAQNRYAELARRLGDDAGGAGDVFRQMVSMEGTHRRVLVERRAALFAGEPPLVEISVADEAVEGPAVDDDLPSSAADALAVAIAAERRAEVFYATVAPAAKDPEVRRFLEGLGREETAHAALLERSLAALGGPGRGAAPPPRPPVTGAGRELFPDRDALRDALPRFDAATRVVAASVVVDGLAEAEVAAALGVSRRTVSRKLAGFLAVARRGAAVLATAAALSGSASADVRPLASAARHAPAASLAEGADDGRLAPRDELAGRVLAQVARRMKRHDPVLHGRVAATIVAEAKEARLDPLLVLALIHVESSFDPVAVSGAGAVGLMQLLEPTMRRELERSKLPPADGRDPVANVRAGVRYLRRLVDAFGDTNVALMAYNAGPNRIRRFLRDGGIPERFHVYPQRIRRELDRLRASTGAEQPLVARADAPTRPRS
jgi:soluble lytic murein transglycosylase-like protein/rubrerythrin